MEVDIAPQFGAELKVLDTPVLCCGASTDIDNSQGWIQECQCLGTPLQIYICNPGAWVAILATLAIFFNAQ